MAVKRYNGTSWDTVAGLGAQGAPATSSSITTWVKTASGGETSLTGSSDSSTTLAYTPGQEQFFINGVLQVRGSDYTATNGTSITGITALVAGDIATVTSVNAFSVTGAVPLSTVTANGDLIVGTSSGAVGRLGVGSTGQLLGVSGGVPAWGGTWTTWSPTVNGITKGNGTEIARYCQIGKTVFFEYSFTLGSTSAITGSVQVSVPVNYKGSLIFAPVGNIMFEDKDTLFYSGSALIQASSNNLLILCETANTTNVTQVNISATVPFTWANTDRFFVSGSYEAD